MVPWYPITPSSSLVETLIGYMRRFRINAEGKATYAIVQAEDEIAAAVGKDRATVANVVRLLRLPDDVRADVAAGTLSMGHARCLLGLTTEGEQRRMARDVIARGLSVRETEALVKKELGTKAGQPAPERDKPTKDVHTRAAEDQLRLSLGTPVEIKRKGKGGLIAIAFTNENELQRLYEYLTEKK